jgi:3-hydroxybutyryl-CoA dehydratase
MSIADIGDSSTVEKQITEDVIADFADVSEDFNPVHTDPEYAQETMFGGRIAHGMISAALISAALADLPGDIIYMSQDLQFEDPVFPGDTVTATVEVEDIDDNDHLHVDTTATVGDNTVLSGQAMVLSLPHESE